ncbi:folylpolyglutamate synthase/dihydrofolate synthase family protein [Sphingomonas sp. 28-62-11]|uniref:bifunctional folylpolyglutamate synthase/dihydrofolate synthase n=1 Tax=Sphingomonas sp. 28-62-11 TaxID=1970432 RepID=UPI000BD7AA3C|nr:MAG: bifunctional folylpolyglutamate synthase/dihydrofolate synthase [Sphingomonas sp. 28-62-11]
MADNAVSSSPAVQAQLDRLWALSPGADILGLERITALLDRIGNPHRELPPVLHVAGTNGKGSTCAFLRAAIEAAGLSCHVYTSPHLVRFNERIRIAGRLIEDDALAALLADVLDAAGDVGASFFEVTTAAAFLAFSRAPADACVIEVGLGGRLDATNVITAPIVTGIAQLGIDHQSFLGDTIEQIAGEKAGIAKPAVSLITMRYPPHVAQRVIAVAERAGAPISRLGTDWQLQIGQGLRYEDGHGVIETGLPRMAGPHQPENLGLAIAMLRHQSALTIPPSAYRAAAEWAEWPARMQRLSAGPLVSRLPDGSELWLDGGHNPAAATAVSAALEARAAGRPVHLILGMLANKDARGLILPFARFARSLQAVPVPDHAHHVPEALAAAALSLGLRAAAADGVPLALDAIATRADPANPPVVLILGSLYLAGGVLSMNGQIPS